MIINKFLNLFSEEYLKSKSVKSLLEFTKKTLPSDGTDKIFIGGVLIMFEMGMTEYAASREHLVSILKAGKEKIGNTNLLYFYVNRISKDKLVVKYLKDIDKDKDFDKHLDLVLEYLEQFSCDFTKNIKKRYSNKIDGFLKNKANS